jgi:hypothetical protein
MADTNSKIVAENAAAIELDKRLEQEKVDSKVRLNKRLNKQKLVNEKQELNEQEVENQFKGATEIQFDKALELLKETGSLDIPVKFPDKFIIMKGECKENKIYLTTLDSGFTFDKDDNVKYYEKTNCGDLQNCNKLFIELVFLDFLKKGGRKTRINRRKTKRRVKSQSRRRRKSVK